MTQRRYDRDWRRDVTLRDGSAARLRWLREGDAERLREGFAALSPESVRLRFHGARGALREGELRYLTRCDQENHLALCAVSLDADGNEREGIGVARCVRLHDTPNVAESAVTVADGAQRRGVGRRLLVHLARAAMERGIDTFRCEVLEENTGVRALLASLAPTVTVRDADGAAGIDERDLVDGRYQAEEHRVLVIDVPLSDAGLRGSAFGATSLAALFRLVAARTLAPLNRLLARLAPGQ